jgi:hypothetical protein
MKFSFILVMEAESMLQHSKIAQVFISLGVLSSILGRVVWVVIDWFFEVGSP